MLEMVAKNGDGSQARFVVTLYPKNVQRNWSATLTNSPARSWKRDTLNWARMFYAICGRHFQSFDQTRSIRNGTQGGSMNHKTTILIAGRKKMVVDEVRKKLPPEDVDLS